MSVDMETVGAGFAGSDGTGWTTPGVEFIPDGVPRPSSALLTETAAALDDLRASIARLRVVSENLGGCEALEAANISAGWGINSVLYICGRCMPRPKAEPGSAGDICGPQIGCGIPIVSSMRPLPTWSAMPSGSTVNGYMPRPLPRVPFLLNM